MPFEELKKKEKNTNIYRREIQLFSTGGGGGGGCGLTRGGQPAGDIK
jgi:hypothetical protein